MQSIYKPMIARKEKTWKDKKEKITRKKNRKKRGKNIFAICIEHEKLTVIDTDLNVDQCFIFTYLSF